MNSLLLLIYTHLEEELDEDTDEEDDDDSSSLSTSYSHSSSDAEEDPQELMDDYEGLKYWVKRYWEHYKPKLLHDYVLAAYCLSPDPKVHEHAKQNIKGEDRLACERLLVKLFLPAYIEGVEKFEREKAAIVNKFLGELDDFQKKSGYFKSQSIWYAAEDPNIPAHLWHQRYSLLFTDYLGKLACIVCSKVLGIGEAERHWKANKKTRGGQRARPSAAKTKKQATIAAAHSMEKAESRRAALARKGKLWDDEDFKAFKLGKSLHFLLWLTTLLSTSCLFGYRFLL